MDTQNQTKPIEPSDASYGGCHYRLVYDHFDKKPQRRKASPLKPGAVVVLLTALVFLLVAFLFIVFDYHTNLKKSLSGGDEAGDDMVKASFQSCKVVEQVE